MPSWFARFSNRYHSHNSEDGGLEAANPPSAAPSTATPTTTATTPATVLPYTYMPIPKERVTTIKGLFGFNTWMGVSIIEWFFVLFYCLVGLMMFLSVFQALLVGSAGIAVMYLVLSPIFFLLLTMGARVICELVLSVLMMPHIMMHKQDEFLQQLQAMNQAATGQRYMSQQDLQQQQTGCPDMEGGRGVGGVGGGFTTVNLHSNSHPGVGGGVGGGTSSSMRGPSNDDDEIGIAMA